MPTFQATSKVNEASWTSREEIETVFGTTQVERWADIENTNDAAKVQKKIDWAVDLATVEAKSRLSGSPAGEVINAPENLRYATTQIAAVLLYESRGIRDVDNEREGRHRLTQHRRQADTFFRRVHAGIIVLDTGSTVTTFASAIPPLNYHPSTGRRLTPEETMEANDDEEKNNIGRFGVQEFIE